jgi:hypothetical protein
MNHYRLSRVKDLGGNRRKRLNQVYRALKDTFKDLEIFLTKPLVDFKEGNKTI